MTNVASIRPLLLIGWPASFPRVAGVLLMAYSNASGTVQATVRVGRRQGPGLVLFAVA